jgi:hypothetical protein
MAALAIPQEGVSGFLRQLCILCATICIAARARRWPALAKEIVAGVPECRF